METYDLQVRIQIDGARGKAELGVPMPAFAQSTLRMQKSLGALLFGCMIFLVIGIVSVVGASVREAQLQPGEVPTLKGLRKARTAMFGASALLLIVIYLGNTWWKVDASNSQTQTWSSNSPNALATLQPYGRLLLRVQGQGDLWTKYIKPENFIPDHGHLMHLFLIRLPYMDRMYHLHPERIEGGAFLENLPTVLAGKYQVFADIVDDNGVPWTAVGQIESAQRGGYAAFRRRFSSIRRASYANQRRCHIGAVVRRRAHDLGTRLLAIESQCSHVLSLPDRRSKR